MTGTENLEFSKYIRGVEGVIAGAGVMTCGAVDNNISFTIASSGRPGAYLDKSDVLNTIDDYWNRIITTRTIGQQSVQTSEILRGCAVYWYANSGEGFTLPNYGTWRYSCFATGDGWGFVGDAAGGSTVTNNSGHTAGGMFVRIA